MSILSSDKPEIRLLKHCSDEMIMNLTSHAELFHSNGIKIDDSAPIFPFPPLSIASQAGYFTPQRTKAMRFFQRLLQCPRDKSTSFFIHHTVCNTRSHFNYCLKQHNVGQGMLISMRHYQCLEKSCKANYLCN